MQCNEQKCKMRCIKSEAALFCMHFIGISCHWFFKEETGAVGGVLINFMYFVRDKKHQRVQIYNVLNY